MSTRFIVFLAASCCLGYVSRAALVRPRSHGFYRFFAWEAMLALVLVTFRSLAQWFDDPLCLRQLASWLLLSGSIVPVVWGAQLLLRRGRPDALRDAPSLFEFEKTTQLVTVGIFRYVRHPLYGSLLLVTWGVFLKRPFPIGAGLAVLASGFLTATARVEESENRHYFGAAYDAYMRTSRMFIPFVF